MDPDREVFDGTYTYYIGVHYTDKHKTTIVFGFFLRHYANT